MAESDCTCGNVYLNQSDPKHPGRRVVSKAWSPDCPVHGLGTPWYTSAYQVRHRMRASYRSVSFQKEARRRRHGGALNLTFVSDLEAEIDALFPMTDLVQIVDSSQQGEVS